MQFDLRNGALRKKYDALKYTLKKLEVRLAAAMTHAFCNIGTEPVVLHTAVFTRITLFSDQQRTSASSCLSLGT
jgi:hypothetical protein